jgi:hypothetical protein
MLLNKELSIEEAKSVSVLRESEYPSATTDRPSPEDNLETQRVLFFPQKFETLEITFFQTPAPAVAESKMACV